MLWLAAENIETGKTNTNFDQDMSPFLRGGSRDWVKIVYEAVYSGL